MKSLKMSVVYYINGNMLLYGIGVLAQFIWIIRLKVSNLARYQQQQNILLGFTILYTFWGFWLAYGTDLDEIVEQNPKLKDFKLLMIWMIWLRLYIVVLIAVVLVFMLFYLIVLFALGRQDEIFAEESP
mmetsp:Transcript_6167/g.9952  ORF Transcript_6167/g.9952 Transcript_6167/m.9952 type:complete len:129 (+) Transcript_6167:845-1231(+)